ncbi:trypsin-like serine peptidase [Rhodococcus qingshengii]|uniref:trypsin-like serine peptidase n=1 Tax=Rhodococcus qingshengii TaxID=334542 RepID=UPI003668BD9E
MATFAMTGSVVAASPASADASVQPDPVGAPLADYLQRDSQGVLRTNGSGGYFVQTPYISNPISKKVGSIYGGEEFEPSSCTATVIESQTGVLAITADHCTNNLKPGGRPIKFAPAAQGGQEPSGGWYIDRKFSSTVSVDGSAPDVAVLVIRPKEGKRITDVTDGGLAIHPGIAAGQTVRGSFIGYPGPAPYNGINMSACVGDYTYHPGKGRSAISRVDGQTECWVGGGASGGPYLAFSDGQAQIITVLNSNGGSAINTVVPQLIEQADSWALNEYNLERSTLAGPAS